jgi:hypothetical protein
MVLATSIIPPNATSLLFTEVTKDLASDQNSLRIRKLLLFVCTRNWENDPHQLEQTNLLELVQGLLAIAPTLEQLQSYLHAIASSLNKSAEYILVANTIINRVSRLYLETCPVKVGARQRDYEAVAQTLGCDLDQLRIKKLLILASRNIWETDVNQLDALSLIDLVREVHSLTPTLESLKAVLDNLAKTLSKQAEYGAIADRICSIFQILYLLKLPALQVHKLELQPEEPSEMTLTESMEEVLHAEPFIKAIAQSDQPEYAYVRQQTLPNLFDLRLDIIQSANPMRVKILLFSMMHEVFVPGVEHDSLLRNHELDDLLSILLQTHKLLNDLESRLLNAAKALKESDEYIQVAEVILRSLKPFYTYLPLKAIAPLASKDDSATNIISVEADLPGTTGPDFPQGDRSPQQYEYTCQVLSLSAYKGTNP